MLTFGNLNRLAAFAAATCICHSSAAIQIMKVSNVGGNVITDGSVTADGFTQTDFGDLAVTGGSENVPFNIHNNGDPVNITGPIVVQGANPGDFTVNQPNITEIYNEQYEQFSITFNPVAAGVRNAIISIPNDTPNTPYTFAVKGTGVNGFPVAVGDLSVSKSGGSILRVKQGKIGPYTNQIKAAVIVRNTNSATTAEATLQVWYRNSNLLDTAEASLILEQPVTGIPPYDPDTLKGKIVRLKVDNINSLGTVFVRVIPTGTKDQNYYNNQANFPFRFF